ncbi:hypothetical protein [Caenimonas sp. SL110]|uniref:hypothetical protein n=1 Tax=Caenimonas sp. SL110 TaxID=1450524 RepID=UPI00069E268C|nr:hypothetical protein [Caenimonas sp. SL110]
MTTPDLTPDELALAKKFAMRCNNRAWALTAQAGRTPAQDREMLNAAHASAYHWGQVGVEQNWMRATMCLALVHALLGHGKTALAMAQEMRDYFLPRADTPDWELAFTHAIYAHAAHVAGDEAAHRSAYQEAVKAIAAIADEEDRKIVNETFAQVPASL